MASTKGQNIAHGILSSFALICGITFSVLIHCMIKRIHERETEAIERLENIARAEGTEVFVDYDNDTPPYWCFGLVFVISGLGGIISAIVRKRWAYITHMVVGIIALLVKLGIFAYAIFGLEYLMLMRSEHGRPHHRGMRPQDTSNHHMGPEPEDDMMPQDSDQMKPRMHDEIEDGPRPEFHPDSVRFIAISILVAAIVGWVITLITTILGGILGCKQEVKEGVVLHAYSANNAGLKLSPEPIKQLDIGYLPQTHDQTKLVLNMECQPGVYAK